MTTHRKRWEKVATAGRPPWDSRNEKIASFIPAGSSVVDLGCGAQTLKQHLKPGCLYQPCDLVRSTPDVIVCDFNSGDFPVLNQQYTYVVCSGVLEYIQDPKEFIAEVLSYGNCLILSFNPLLPGQSAVDRMVNNWVNHSSQTELEKLFGELGLAPHLLHTSQHGELIYRLQRIVHQEQAV